MKKRIIFVVLHKGFSKNIWVQMQLDDNNDCNLNNVRKKQRLRVVFGHAFQKNFLF